MAGKGKSDAMIGIVLIMLGIGMIAILPSLTGAGGLPDIGGGKAKVVCQVTVGNPLYASPRIDSLFCEKRGNCLLGIYNALGNPMSLFTSDGTVFMVSSDGMSSDRASYSVMQTGSDIHELSVCSDTTSGRIILYDNQMKILDQMEYEVAG